MQLQAAGRWDVYCQVCALGDTGPLCAELWHVLLVLMDRSRAVAVDALLTCASRAPLGADLVLSCTRPAPVRCTTTTRLACGRRWWSLTRDDHPPAAAAAAAAAGPCGPPTSSSSTPLLPTAFSLADQGVWRPLGCHDPRHALFCLLFQLPSVRFFACIPFSYPEQRPAVPIAPCPCTCPPFNAGWPRARPPLLQHPLVLRSYHPLPQNRPQGMAPL